jgi:hypothetical protein
LNLQHNSYYCIDALAQVLFNARLRRQKIPPLIMIWEIKTDIFCSWILVLINHLTLMIFSFDKGKYCVVIISSVNVSFSTCSNPNVLWMYRLSYFTLGSIMYTRHSCGTNLCIPHLCWALGLMLDILACHNTQLYYITCICIFIMCLLWTFQCWWWLYKWFALWFLAATWRTCESEARTILSCSGKNVARSRVF